MIELDKRETASFQNKENTESSSDFKQSFPLRFKKPSPNISQIVDQKSHYTSQIDSTPVRIGVSMYKRNTEQSDSDDSSSIMSDNVQRKIIAQLSR